MKPSLILWSIFTVLVSTSKQSFAQTAGYQLGDPEMAGNGCPQGSASAAISPDGSAISILFDRFAIDARRGGNAWDQMRKNCRFRIPVAVTPGYTLQAVQVDYRGFADVQKGNHAFVITTGAFVGLGDMVVGNEKTRSELRNLTGDFLVSQQIPAQASNCKSDNSIDFSVFLQMFGPAAKGPLYLLQDASIVLDSTDLVGSAESIRFKVVLRACN